MFLIVCEVYISGFRNHEVALWVIMIAPRPSQQDVETFLSEVRVMSKHIGDSALPHDIHRNAVGEAVGLVGPRFVKG
jgi:hypothetical protein